MKKRWFILAAVGVVLLLGYTVIGYSQQEKGMITSNELEIANNGGNPEKIAQDVLAATGRTDQYDLKDAENVTVYYGDVLLGDSQDAIVSVRFGPRDTIIAAYTPEGDVYQYVGEVGRFEQVQNVQFVPVTDLERDVVVVKEGADQHLGAFEQSTFFRGYVYEENGEFRSVLDVPENIQSSWNEIWDQEGLQEESNWVRVTQNSESNWESGDNPALNLTRLQKYLISNDANTKNIPKDETFQSQKEQVITERQYWDKNWNRFILGEATDSNGNRVAILEDYSKSPYILTEDDTDYNRSRIYRQDGTYDIVSNSELTPIEPETSR